MWVERGVARLEDGTLAGATRPLAWGLRMLVELGVPLVEAVAAVTTTPARLVGRPDAGALTVGGPADLVVLDDAFAVRSTLVGRTPARLTARRQATAGAVSPSLTIATSSRRRSTASTIAAQASRIAPAR